MTIAIGLLACAPGALAATARTPALPDRAQVQAALDLWMACADPTEAGCRPPPHIMLSASHCWPDLPGLERAGRVVCRFSGRVSGGTGPATRAEGDCVYLARNPAGAWRFVGFLDWDICEEYR